MVARPPTKKALVRKVEASGAPKEASTREDEAAAGTGSTETHEPKKKTKEFAWMDSDEEGEEEGEQGKDKEKATKSGSEDEDADADVSRGVLDSVETFGRMMVLSPALLKKMPRMQPEEVAAACRALTRTKFFDGDILRKLVDVVKRLLAQDRLDLQQVDDVFQCLWRLNLYDQEVVSAIAKQFKVKTGTMDTTLRNAWLGICKGFNHTADQDFLQLLEVPHMTALNPGFKRLRCAHFTRGACAVGEACTWAHDLRAPVELAAVSFRPVSKVMMTGTQAILGKDVYGGFRNGQIH
eukprot:TRINITY_DN31593_c0_g1_i2.p1 TRINITY_DN31593_c0_g1~~TRINITY_DN31593_c0_g1_i2.p1  ORF type:complete len:345 (-),score=80.63 TRINITY_DN31593_c0_g1_i2:242-1126(-)